MEMEFYRFVFKNSKMTEWIFDKNMYKCVHKTISK